MAPIVVSVEISRRPEDVFAYVTDPSRLPEWQASAVKVQADDAPTQVGTRAVVTRQAGPREMDMAVEVDEFNPPRSWGVRGVDGPVRGNVKGRIEPAEVSGAGHAPTVEEPGVDGRCSVGVPFGSALVVNAFDPVAAISERHDGADNELLVALERGVDALLQKLVDDRVAEAGHEGIIA